MFFIGRATLPASSIKSESILRTFSSASKRRSSLARYPFIPNDSTTEEQAVTNILYNTPQPTSSNPTTKHILNCLVKNEPGVLARVSGTLAGRGFNIDSLVVSRTEVPMLSRLLTLRMTIVVNGKHPVMIQARKQLEDLVPVYAVFDYTHSKAVHRELLILKVLTIPKQENEENNGMQGEEVGSSINALLAAALQRQTLSELANLFNAKVSDVIIDRSNTYTKVSLNCMMIELCAKPERVDAFVALLRPFGIMELSRSGLMVMLRDPVMDSGSGEENDEEEVGEGKIDESKLPPG